MGAVGGMKASAGAASKKARRNCFILTMMV